MKSLQKMFILLTLSIVYSCSSNHEPGKDESVTFVDEKDYIAQSKTSIATNNLIDTSTKFVRTIDFKFKVKDLTQSTFFIEHFVSKMGGYVADSKLNSVVDHTSNIKFSEDSTCEITQYQMTNKMLLRVPNNQLDTVLSEIAKHIIFLDYRQIKTEDYSSKILANKLELKNHLNEEMLIKNTNEIKSKKINEAIDAYKKLQNASTQKNIATIENNRFNDLLNYSTISLDLYQHQTIKSETFALPPQIKPFEPNLGDKIIDAFNIGLNFLIALLLFIFKFWGVILVLTIGYYILKKYKPFVVK